MAEWYLTDKPIILICINDSYSCINNTVVKSGWQCYTKQLDFGGSYLNWVGIFINDIYYGAHRSENFVSLAMWRDMRIDQILD